MVVRVAQAAEDGLQHERSAADPSASSSLEHLLSGSQGVIAKKLDLALLEVQEMLSGLLERSALAGLAVLLAAGAWFAVAAALALLVSPDGGWPLRLVAFGSSNAAGAYWLLSLARRSTPSRVSP